MMGNTQVETVQSNSVTPLAKSVGAGRSMPFWEPLLTACAQMTPRLQTLLHEFWGAPVAVSFLSASMQNQYFWRMDDFHVSQLMLGEAALPDVQSDPPTALLRISDAACSAWLSRVLGPRPASQKAFSFTQLSPLEATILNELSRDVLALFMKHLVKKPSAKSRRAETVHLVWTTRLEQRISPTLPADQPMQFVESFEVGKIVLSLPLNAIQLPLPPHADGLPPETISDAFFDHVETPAQLWVGSTRIPLADLNQLEPDDLVVLETSRVDRMALVLPGTKARLPFALDVSRLQSIALPDVEEFAMMETQSSQNADALRQSLWDNLMIEVSAEFEPIKLPLKQLRQMSEGLVVELGDIIDNRLCLQVEGRTLAWGELVVVGDKFAVRISQVEATASGGGTTAEAQADAAAMAPGSALALAGDDDPEGGALLAADDAARLEGAPDNPEQSDTFLNEDDFGDSFEDDDEEDWL